MLSLLFSILRKLHFFYVGKLTEISEAAIRGVLCKKVFLEISQNSQENTGAGVSFNKIADLVQLY